MPDWHYFDELKPYQSTYDEMNAHVELIKQNKAEEAVWLLSHEAVYTGGTSATETDILHRPDIPFIETGRGGQWTYHGPGIRVVYPLLDLNHRTVDLRLYVHSLEAWVIDILACFGVLGVRRDGLPGVWVRRENSPDEQAYDKIAALGVRVSKWVTSHGFALNVNPDLEAFRHIIPCGVEGSGVTSLAALGLDISMAEIDMAIKDCYAAHFGKDAPMGLKD